MATPPDPPRDSWLTRREAADHARVSLSTIDRALATGELRSVRMHGIRRTRVRWVDAWLLGRGAVIAALVAALFLFALVATVAGHCRILHIDGPRCIRNAVSYTSDVRPLT